MSNYTELKRLVDRVLTDRRFCGDESHKALADGVLALIAENVKLASTARLARVWAEMKVHEEVGRSTTNALLVMWERDQLKADNAAALREATDLALAIWRRFYAKDSPNFQPFEKASSVIGQIDNMAAGLMSDLGKLKAENAALRKERTDWQAECLKRGFEYVRESDDHYVLADLPEMADLLGMLLGVEVRTKDNDAYEEANSRLNEQVEGLINTIHKQESMRKDAERWRFVRNPTATGSPFAVWSERTNLFLGKFADEAIDAARGKGEQSEGGLQTDHKSSESIDPEGSKGGLQ